MGIFSDGFVELKKAGEPLYKAPKSIQETIKQQRVRNKNNDFSTEISYAKRTEKKEIEGNMDDVRENDQCLFYVAVTIIIVAETKEELESITETIETIGKRNSVTIDIHFLKQREALNTALPIGVRQVETMRSMLTQSVAVLLPFNVQEMNDEGGIYYGINQISKNVNVGNRKKLLNGNGFVFGVPGSGKSFFCKQGMGQVFLNTNDDVIVIDPMNEYFDIAKTFGGAIVNMSAYTGDLNHYGNDFDIFYASHEDTGQWGRRHVEAYLAEGNANKVMVTSSGSTVHNLTYKDYIDKGILTDDQKKMLDDMMDSELWDTYYSGAAGQSVAELAMSKIGCRYSQARRYDEGYYDCSSLVYRLYKEIGIELPATASTQGR